MQTSGAIRKGRYNLLYIDDEQNNIIVFKNAFFRYYNIFTALSGEEGLKILRENDIDLVITDQKMPGMTGVEVLEQVVREFPDTMRMILTAYSDIEVIMKAINECGIYQYLLKPWDAREVKIVIDNALENHRLTESNKQLLADLKSANEDLEEKVRVRTEELTRINSVKDKLFSIISHDLRTPMASLKVFLDVLMNFNQGQIDQQKVEEYYLKVQGYIHNVMSLLDNLLNWSLTQLGEKEPVLADVSLSQSVATTQELVSLLAAKKKVSVATNLPDEEVTITGDANMISLVLRNLLGNAIKFSEEHTTITISLQTDEQHAWLEIQDEGVGMPQDVRDNLFNPHYHQSTRGTGDEKGAGLGLKLCQEFVSMQSGTIKVESELEKGTTFTLSFPLAG